MKHKHLSLFVIIVLVSKLLTIGGLFIVYPNEAFFASVTSTEVISITNQKREEIGLPKLIPNERLNRVAQMKLDDMFQRQYFSHTSPDGEKIWPLLIAGNYEYAFAGENLAMNFYSSSEVVDAWLASERHKNNLFSKQFEDVGVAVGIGTINGQNINLIVQVFGKEQYGDMEDFRKTVTQTLGISGSETVVMGEYDQPRVASRASWLSYAIQGTKSLALLLGAFISLCMFLFSMYEAKHYHRRLAHGLVVLGVIVLVLTLNVHFMERITGSLMIG